ncbi:hypothetical protein ACVIYH_009061 [Bradyrhizobium diazoefficiens]
MNWKPISERLPWDEQPGRQFIRIEGYAEHSGAKWHRVYVGDAMARKLDDPEAILGFRAADIIRLCKDGDIDLHSAEVTHWMPAIWPALALPSDQRGTE